MAVSCFWHHWSVCLLNLVFGIDLSHNETNGGFISFLIACATILIRASIRGEIKIGGIDLTRLSRADYLRFRRKISPEAISEAAKSANLEDTINNLPKKTLR